MPLSNAKESERLVQTLRALFFSKVAAPAGDTGFFSATWCFLWLDLISCHTAPRIFIQLCCKTSSNSQQMQLLSHKLLPILVLCWEELSSVGRRRSSVAAFRSL